MATLTNGRTRTIRRMAPVVADENLILPATPLTVPIVENNSIIPETIILEDGTLRGRTLVEDGTLAEGDIILGVDDGTLENGTTDEEIIISSPVVSSRPPSPIRSRASSLVGSQTMSLPGCELYEDSDGEFEGEEFEDEIPPEVKIAMSLPPGYSFMNVTDLAGHHLTRITDPFGNVIAVSDHPEAKGSQVRGVYAPAAESYEENMGTSIGTIISRISPAISQNKEELTDMILCEDDDVACLLSVGEGMPQFFNRTATGKLGHDHTKGNMLPIPILSYDQLMENPQEALMRATSATNAIRKFTEHALETKISHVLAHSSNIYEGATQLQSRIFSLINRLEETMNMNTEDIMSALMAREMDEHLMGKAWKSQQTNLHRAHGLALILGLLHKLDKINKKLKKSFILLEEADAIVSKVERKTEGEMHALPHTPWTI